MADVADQSFGRQNTSVIRISEAQPGRIGFPDFEQANGLRELAEQIAAALGITARPAVGSPLELLIGFVGFPDAFQLWWDGVTCELACGEPCDVNMEDVLESLMSSGRFRAAE